MSIQLDQTDIAILAELSVDGRRSYTDLAAQLGVAVGTIRNRVKRLEEQGTVRFVGLINPNHAGFNAYATIHIRVSPTRLLDDVIAQLKQISELNFLASVTGDFDLHADVVCIDNDHLNKLLREQIHQIEGVVDTKTTMVLHAHVYDGQIDIGMLNRKAS